MGDDDDAAVIDELEEGELEEDEDAWASMEDISDRPLVGLVFDFIDLFV
jgi:hypothetical protein